MSISSQLPPISLAQASASLRALAQAAGQTVEARIISQSNNGTSQVQIGRQVLNLALPEGQAVGSTLTLSVQQSDGQLRLAIVSVRPPAISGGMAPQPGVTAAPATNVQLSAAALSSPSLTQAVPAGVSVPATTPAASSVAVPSGQPGQSAAAPAVAPGATAPRPVSYYGAPPVQGTPPTASQATAMPAAVTTSTGTAPGSGSQVGQAPAPNPVPVGTTGPVAAGSATVRADAPVVQGAMASSAAMPPAAASSPLAASGQTQAVVPPPVAAAPVQAATPGQVPVRAEIPYAVAAPATALPQTTAVTGSAASGLPPVAQMAAGTMVGQHAPNPNAAAPQTAGLGQPGAGAGGVPVPSPAAATPQAAIAQMVQQSMPRQDSVIGLTTALTAIAGKVALPEPVAKAAQQVLAARLPLDGVKLSGAGIKAAVQLSGVFQEALLASGQGQLAAGDMKSALLSLRQSLGAWLGNQAPVAQVSGIAPPIRGHIPRARAGDGAPPGLPDDPLELGKVLAERTDAALSRLRLHQNASLPDPSGHRQDAQWSMDLPVIVGGQQQLLHMQIQRDAEQEGERSEERSWQVRFAINLAERGEVGAQISLRAKNTGVLLWADHAETAQALAGAADGLREALGEAGLIAGAIVVRTGAPAMQPSQPAAGAGHMLDATR